MPTFDIENGDSTTFTDTTPGEGIIIDFRSLDNSFNVQVNGVDLFVGGPAGSPNELEFQAGGTNGQTVRFADGDRYANEVPEIYQLGNPNGPPIVRLVINPDGTISLMGAKTPGGPLEPLELFNGLTVNTAAIDAAWNDSGSNTIVVDQIVTGPTNADGDFTDVPCFTAGTWIETMTGHVKVEDLKVSDCVKTRDNGSQRVRWIGSCRISSGQLCVQPNLRPVRIRADALGAGFPEHDLVVSPQHRILVSSAVAMRMFGCSDILVPAKKLLPLEGIDIVEDNPDGVEYWHVLFDDHQVIWSNGAATESLLTGREALNSVSPEARAEIESLFPEVTEPDFAPVSACHIPEKGKLMKDLVRQHRKIDKPVFSQLAMRIKSPAQLRLFSSGETAYS